jgi:hypothetical protein
MALHRDAVIISASASKIAAFMAAFRSAADIRLIRCRAALLNRT